MGANGPITLSVPLQKGRNQHSLFRDLLIAYDENWQKDHYKSILSAYNGSPFFPYYAASLAELFRQQPASLMEWNLACFDWVKQKLKEGPAYEVLTGEENRGVAAYLIDRRNTIYPGSEFSQEGVDPYPQVFADRFPFAPGLSILDLLFCLGPGETLLRLKN